MSLGQKCADCEKYKAIKELFKEVDRRVIWECLGLGNDLADRIESALYDDNPHITTKE